MPGIGNPRKRFGYVGMHRLDFRKILGSMYWGKQAPKGTTIKRGLSGHLAQHHMTNPNTSYARGRRWLK